MSIQNCTGKRMKVKEMRPKIWLIVLSVLVVISSGIGLIACSKVSETDGQPAQEAKDQSMQETSGQTPREPVKEQEAQAESLEPVAVKWTPDQTLGVDFPILDYASEDRVIFHGYFGLFVYDFSAQQMIRSVDLVPIGCQDTQGDNFCEVVVSEDGNAVTLHPLSSEHMYVYTVSDNTLKKVPYQKTGEKLDRIVPITEVIDDPYSGNYSYTAVKFDNGEFGYLQALEWNIGSIEYVRAGKAYRLFGEKDSGSAAN